MDNFASWVDAPTAGLIATPDESVITRFLREEILQSRQFVSDKLDDSEHIEKVKEERANEERLKKQRLENEICAENRRAESVRKQLNVLKNASANVEKQLISMKKNVQTSDPLTTNTAERLEKNLLELVSIKNQILARTNDLEKLKLSAGGKNGDKTEFKKWKTAVLEVKEAYEKLVLLRKTICELENEHSLDLTRQKALNESIAKSEEEAKEQQIKLGKLNEQNAELRAELVQIESARAKSMAEKDEKELESIEKHTEQMRESTAELRRKLEEINGQEADFKKRLDELTNVSPQSLEQLVRKKLEETKKKSEDVLEMKRIKMAIKEEREEIERLRQENSASEFGKGVSFKKELSLIGAAINEQDRLRKVITKEHEELLEEIARHRQNSKSADLNATMEIDHEAILPHVTPVHSRQISVDVISGAPLMTSTPRAPTAPAWRPSAGTPMVQSAMQTRAVTRLAKKAEKTTKNLRKKK